MNVIDNISQLSILWTLAPGASCHGLGVRAGTTLKRLLGFSFESVIKVTNSTTNSTINSTANSTAKVLSSDSPYVVIP